jgi:CspA family cold shock protein
MRGRSRERMFKTSTGFGDMRRTATRRLRFRTCFEHSHGPCIRNVPAKLALIAGSTGRLTPYFANVEDRQGMCPAERDPFAPRARPQPKVQTMINGTVKFYNTARGFGFIQPNDGSKDAFVHATALESAGISMLAEGQKVAYDLESGRDGKTSAVNLQLA